MKNALRLRWTSLTLATLSIGAVLVSCAKPEVDALEPLTSDAAALEWFQAARFGLFVHWGPVSLEGTEIGWSRGREVPDSRYDSLYLRFDPVHFDAAEWARTAREAGMRYLVLTSRHHDGFSLWDTRFSEYDIMSSPFRRDIVGELAEACRKEGIRFGLYYSLADWYHPDYPLGSPGGSTPKEHPDMARYLDFVHDQTAELLERYGPLLVLWFDGEWEEPWTQEMGNALYDSLKVLQPGILINNRVSKGRDGMAGTTILAEENAGDFDTPEQRIGRFNIDRPWESCVTIGTQWAWKPDDPIKSVKESLHLLIGAVTGDGNLLFNVGPMPDGRIEPGQVARLREMGEWLRRNGESVYGTRGGPWVPGPWGGSTHRADSVYLHITAWPADTLVLPAPRFRVREVRRLDGEQSLTWSQEAGGLRIHVPVAERDPIDTIVALRVDAKPGDLLQPIPTVPPNSP